MSRAAQLLNSMEKPVCDNLCYHYTSVDTFIKILDGIEDDNFKFHASSIFSLNDPSEMEYGYREIAKLMPQIEDVLSINDMRYKLSGIWNLDPQLSLDKWMNYHIKKMKEHFQHSCVISYSRNRDNLQLWGMYGNNGMGLALGFDLRVYFKEMSPQDGLRILNSTHIDFDTPHALDVEYDTIPPMSLPYYLVRAEYSRYWKAVQGVMDKNEIIDKQIDALSQMVMVAAPFVKHRAYDFEKESRIIQVHKKVEDIKIKSNTRRGLVPYIEVKIPTSCLKEVIVGPCCDFDLIKKCIEIKLSQRGMRDVEITASVVPYRG